MFTGWPLKSVMSQPNCPLTGSESVVVRRLSSSVGRTIFISVSCCCCCQTKSSKKKKKTCSASVCSGHGQCSCCVLYFLDLCHCNPSWSKCSRVTLPPILPSLHFYFARVFFIFSDPSCVAVCAGRQARSPCLLRKLSEC